jgi:hypothetical protein
MNVLDRLEIGILDSRRVGNRGQRFTGCIGYQMKMEEAVCFRGVGHTVPMNCGWMLISRVAAGKAAPLFQITGDLSKSKCPVDNAASLGEEIGQSRDPLRSFGRFPQARAVRMVNKGLISFCESRCPHPPAGGWEIMSQSRRKKGRRGKTIELPLSTDQQQLQPRI